MRIFILLGFFCVSFSLLAQEEKTDSTRVLDEVVVKAYRSDRPLKDVPVTVNVLDNKDMIRFGPMSMVTTVNTVPGVRMEERSPGSYRFSIRGSVLRSPFGIRNVKFYWKGLPFTDAGGNTYLNLFDLSTLGRMEIIKGPGASLYGAGTGGVVLLDSPPIASNYFGNVSLQFGSYGLKRLAGETIAQGKRTKLSIGFSLQGNDGYRDQTQLSRMNARIGLDQAIGKKGKLSITLLAAHLNYGTPGGLTQTQFEADARQARPATPTLPGAVEQKATIDNTSLYGGAVYEHDWNEHWSSSIGVYGMHTDFKNPAILNYEERIEGNWGGRTEHQYSFGKNEQKGKITFGAEFQSFDSPDDVYDNNGGNKGNLRTSDKLHSKSAFGFAQAEYQLPYKFLVTAGGSINFLKYDFHRTSPEEIRQERNFKPGFFPRLALIKKFTEQLSVYSSISNGFSAPSLAEVRPSTGNFNNTLNPERGRSIEVGIRSELFNRQLRLNVAAYDFRLKETIVVQAAVNGADYFINAGTTSQKGIESTISWVPTWGTERLGMFRLWMSYTYNNYHFLNYTNGGKDFSGNRITGVPPTVVVSGLDMTLKQGWYLNTSLNYTDHIPVNDANSEFAHDYKVLSARIGKRQTIWRFENLDIFAGIDNALNQKYSLGNDLNAAGGRYYNVAPARNFYVGLTIPLYSKPSSR